MKYLVLMALAALAFSSDSWASNAHGTRAECIAEKVELGIPRAQAVTDCTPGKKPKSGKKKKAVEADDVDAEDADHND